MAEHLGTCSLQPHSWQARSRCWLGRCVQLVAVKKDVRSPRLSLAPVRVHGEQVSLGAMPAGWVRRWGAGGSMPHFFLEAAS